MARFASSIRAFASGERWQNAADDPLGGVQTAPHQVVLPPFAIQERAEVKQRRARQFSPLLRGGILVEDAGGVPRADAKHLAQLGFAHRRLVENREDDLVVVFELIEDAPGVRIEASLGIRRRADENLAKTVRDRLRRLASERRRSFSVAAIRFNSFLMRGSVSLRSRRRIRRSRYPRSNSNRKPALAPLRILFRIMRRAARHPRR